MTDRAKALRRWAEENGYGTLSGGDSRSQLPKETGTPVEVGNAALSPAENVSFASPLERDGVYVLDIETSDNDPWKGDLLAVGLGSEVHRPDDGRALVRGTLKRLECTIVCHTTYDLRWMILDGARMGDDITFHDTKVMAWMLDATQELSLDSLVEKYCGYRPDKRIIKRGGQLMFRLDSDEYIPIAEVPWEQMKAYNQSDIDATTELYGTLKRELERRELWSQFQEEEVPFSRLLVEIETTGVPFDKEACIDLRENVSERADDMRQELTDAVGVEDFNPGSPQQVSKFLYDEIFTLNSRIVVPRMKGMPMSEKIAMAQNMAPKGFQVERVGRDYAHGRYVLEGRGLRPPKIDKNKPADSLPSVAGPLLQVLHADDPWVSRYLKWRKTDKLLSGFLNVWPEQSHNGRLYSRLDQSSTVTGRLAGKEPNLQQVPAHDEFGIRGLFAGPLIVGDYAGLEVRLSAHFSQDPAMLDIFRSGKDFYGVLAAHAWGGPESKENEHRDLFKVIMLGSQYGARGEKLAHVLAVEGMTGYSGRKADALLKDLEHTLPRLFEWREEVIAEGRAMGYVTTLAGRKRHLPDINSAVWRLMALSERQAVNSKVQGSAADIVRRAMLKARAAFDPGFVEENVAERDIIDGGFRHSSRYMPWAPEGEARIILQVHDEIMWERGPAWDDARLSELKRLCEEDHGFDLSVPLAFDVKLASSWAEKGKRSDIMDGTINV